VRDNSVYETVEQRSLTEEDRAAGDADDQPVPCLDRQLQPMTMDTGQPTPRSSCRQWRCLMTLGPTTLGNESGEQEAPWGDRPQRLGDYDLPIALHHDPRRQAA